MKKTISETQELCLKLMEKASFNNFDGARVSDELRRMPHLWECAMMTPTVAHLLHLRDLRKDVYNVDTLWIIAVEGKEMELFELVHTWHADNVEWYPTSEARKLLGGLVDFYNQPEKDNKYYMLYVWWD